MAGTHARVWFFFWIAAQPFGWFLLSIPNPNQYPRTEIPLTAPLLLDFHSYRTQATDYVPPDPSARLYTRRVPHLLYNTRQVLGSLRTTAHEDELPSVSLGRLWPSPSLFGRPRGRPPRRRRRVVGLRDGEHRVRPGEGLRQPHQPGQLLPRPALRRSACRTPPLATSPRLWVRVLSIASAPIDLYGSR